MMTCFLSGKPVPEFETKVIGTSSPAKPARAEDANHRVI
jgi:hypothetical protein